MSPSETVEKGDGLALADLAHAGDLMVTHCRSRLRAAMAEMLSASDEDRQRREFEVEVWANNLSNAEIFKATHRTNAVA